MNVEQHRPRFATLCIGIKSPLGTPMACLSLEEEHVDTEDQ